MDNIYKEELTKDESKLHWKVTDVIINKENGEREVREYYNTVVDGCAKLIASFMKNETGFKGITYWAVGSGEETWSNTNPPNPVTSASKLVNEIYRKPISASNITFLDENDKPTENITTKLEIKLQFLENEANGALREFALFGGDATGTKGSGIMINHKIHPIIYKTSSIILERTIRLIF